jgi:hypothetical protein
LGLPPGAGFGGPTTTIPRLCPFPQKAIYKGGPTDDTNSYTCGGDLQTNAVICDGLRTAYKQENKDKLQGYGGDYNPAKCKDNSQPVDNRPPH